MAVEERWARIQDQIDLMHEARVYGGPCAWCGSELSDSEPVSVERFLVGARRAPIPTRSG